MQTKHGPNSSSAGRLLWHPTCYRRMPSSLRTTRTQTAPTTRRKGTRSFPGLHAVDDICPGILAGVCIRYMRVRMPVAHKGEWRPKQRRRARERACEEFVADRTASLRIPRHAVLPPVRCFDPYVLRAGRRQGLCSRSSMTRRLIGHIGCRPCKQHPRRRRRRPHATSSDAAVPPNRLRRAQSSRRSRSK